MDLEVSIQVPEFRRKVAFAFSRFQAFKKTKGVFFNFPIFRNFLEQYKYYMLLDCT